MAFDAAATAVSMRSHVTYETPRVFGQTAWRNNGFNAGLLRASSGSADLLAAPLPQVTSPQRNDSGSTFLQSSADHMEGRVVEETKNQRSIELNHAKKRSSKCTLSLDLRAVLLAAVVRATLHTQFSMNYTTNLLMLTPVLLKDLTYSDCRCRYLPLIVIPAEISSTVLIARSLPL